MSAWGRFNPCSPCCSQPINQTSVCSGCVYSGYTFALSGISIDNLAGDFCGTDHNGNRTWNTIPWTNCSLSGLQTYDNGRSSSCVINFAANLSSVQLIIQLTCESGFTFRSLEYRASSGVVGCPDTIDIPLFSAGIAVSSYPPNVIITKVL